MILSLKSVAIATMFSIAVAGIGQTPPPTDPAKPPAEAKKEEPKKPEPKPGTPKPYEEVITKEAKTQEGLFKVHRIDDKVFFEIPPAMLGRDILWQTEVAELPSGDGFAFPGTPAGVKLVKFTRRNNKIYLRQPSYSLRAEGDDAQKLGVQRNSLEPILMAFDVQAESKEKAPVIEVTQLFTSDPQDFSAKAVLGGASVDAGRSYVDAVKAFPINIEVRSMLTYTKTPGRGGSAATALIHYSLVQLPEKPMMGRLKDSRIGYFTSSFDVVGRPENRFMSQEYIDRFRLEKKDDNAAVSEPKQPIVYYLAREIPSKWRPYVKKGIEDWQPAFEQAGFKKAIIAKDAPSIQQDPDWHEEDARYSVIRWAPSATQNAMGPSIQDPRSGETISAHVIVWHNILQLVEEWYYSQCAAIDPQAKKLPLPMPLMGELVRYVVAHEVGHTLGLEHNMKASSVYTVAQLRNPAFTAKNGVSCSIMDYSRFNYVAQPGDGVKRTIGMIGPYDKFAIEYGYKPIASAKTPDDEKKSLDPLLAKQVTDPRLRFGNYRYYMDPTTQSEDIGNDAIEATRLGLKNLNRIGNMMLTSTTKYGEDYEIARAMWSSMMFQRLMELSHVIGLVGGVVETDYHAGRGDTVFKPIPATRQAAAVRFLLNEGLSSDQSYWSAGLMSKLQPTGMIDEVTNSQRMVLNSLMREDRLKRLADNEAANGANAYTLARFTGDVFGNIWHELATPSPKVNIYRRTLQRSFLKSIDGKLNGSAASGTDFKPLARQQLASLIAKLGTASRKSTDPSTRAHLVDCRVEAIRILENKNPAASGSGGSFLSFFMVNGDKNETQGCWNPYQELARAYGE